MIRYVQLIVCEKSSVIIAPSYFLKKIIQKWGVTSDKIVVIYNPVDIDEIIKITPKDLPSSIIPILAVGRLVPRKGFETILASMSSLVLWNKKIHLFIIGEGPLLENLKIKCRISNLDSHVTFVGQVPTRIVCAYLKSGVALLLPTEYEGFSFLILEAMICRIPIITTSVCGNSEIVKNLINSIIIPPKNEKMLIAAVKKITSNRNLGRPLVDQAYLDANKYNWDKYLDNLLNIINNSV